MKKYLYVILDSVNNEFGEVLSFNNDDEAKRAFAWSVHLSPVPFRDSLELHKVGIITNEFLSETDEIEFIDPSVSPIIPSNTGSSLITASCFDDTREMVAKFDTDEQEKTVFMQQLAKNCKDVFSAQDFVNNVSKLSRFMSKDRRFKRL